MGVSWRMAVGTVLAMRASIESWPVADNMLICSSSLGPR